MGVDAVAPRFDALSARTADGTPEMPIVIKGAGDGEGGRSKGGAKAAHRRMLRPRAAPGKRRPRTAARYRRSALAIVCSCMLLVPS